MIDSKITIRLNLIFAAKFAEYPWQAHIRIGGKFFKTPIHLL